MSIGLLNSVLNQKNAPAIYEDIFANRPSAGFSGRIFISTDTSQIFVDNGTSWVLIANTGIGSTGNLQVVTTNGNTTSAGIVITAGGLTTNAITQASLTSGSVIFATTGGQLSQDNSNLFWDNTNKWLGIGTAPSSPLDIHSSAAASMLALNNTGGNASNIIFLNASVNKWRIGNTSSNTFDLFNNQIGTTALSFSGSNSAATFINSITATSLIKSGGTSSQFLKADGSVDSSAYITLTSLSATSPVQYNSSTGAFSILQSNASQSGYLSSTDWNTFNSKASLAAFSATTPLSYNSGTGAFSIQVANTGQSGYLTNTDWNTFNSKQSALSFGNLTETSSSVLTIAGGTGAVIGSGTTIAVKQSSAIQSGYLSSTDWNTFNNKQPQINGTGFVKASGTTISYDNSTYYLASNPSAYISLSSLSGTTPITYNSGTGAISIAQANTSTSGFLSSTDWNTFNNKASLSAFSASPPLSYNSGTGAFSITQSSGSTNGYLSSTDWTTFNNKQSALTNPITGTGTSGYVPKFNGTTSLTNSAIFDNGGNIGINNTNSYNKLDIVQVGSNNTVAGVGLKIVSDASNSASMAFSQTARGTATIGMQGSGSAPCNFVIGTDVTGAFLFKKGLSGTYGTDLSTGTTQMTLDALGNLGLGVTPSAWGGYTAIQIGQGALSNGNGSNVVNVHSNAYYNGSNYIYIANGEASLYQQAGGGHNWRIAPSGTAGNPVTFTQAMTLGNDGNLLLNGATSSNGQGKLQNTGQSFTGGLGIGGLTFSTNTTASVNTSFYFFNGGAGVTLTLPDTNGQSMIYYIKNYSASPLTIGRTGSNTFIAAGTITTVTSLTLATGVSTTIIGNGTTNYIQIQ
jgi:hypothetical protein